ncbi:ADP-ribosylation factor-related protein 1 isoform X6 [Oryctolagus cuniculus]|uniref:ADP-ribosylation factor-related protein 1 isoform X6 n=1 Tax=Oryctolagus cuniculus TaxID=9986 RepID=UPI0038799BD0
MYTLLSGLYKYMFQKDEYCILILGLDNAGKTTFLEQSKTRFSKNYKGMSLSKITTTVGLNIGTVDVGKARLMFWDLGGQEELQSLWDKPLPGVAPEVVVERSPGAAGRRPGSPSRTLLPARHMWTIKTRDQPGPGLLVQTRGTQVFLSHTGVLDLGPAACSVVWASTQKAAGRVGVVESRLCHARLPMSRQAPL